MEQVDTAFTEELTSQREHFDSWKNDDPILPRLERCIEVGTAPDSQWLENSLTKAKERIENEIPPGYLDASKDKDKEPKFYWNGNRIPRKYGDVFLWLQLIERTQKRGKETSRNHNRVIFVSNDQKPDWTRRGADGQIYGPRRELIDEMLTKGQCTDFWIYPLDRYLEIAGRIFNLDTQVAVTEAEEIKVAHYRENQPARRRLHHTSTGRVRKVDFLEEDPELLSVWETWKDAIGEPDLPLTLKKRNYLRSVISEHRSDLVRHAIEAWTANWFDYDDEDFVTEDSAARVWGALDEIICTNGEGYPPPPEPPENFGENLGIDDIPF